MSNIDKTNELIAIRTLLKQKYRLLGFRRLSQELGGILSPGQINNFINGRDLDDDALEVVKNYIDWDDDRIDEYLEIYYREESVKKAQNQGYIPVPPDGELEALEKDWASWERVFNGEHPYLPPPK